MPFTYIGDLIRLRPEEAKELIFRTYRVRGCSVAATAKALGMQRRPFQILLRRHGVEPELRRIRERRERLLGLP